MSSYFFGGFSASGSTRQGGSGTTRMLFQPWMIGRALHREIERDFHVVLLQACTSRRKSASVPSSDALRRGRLARCRWRRSCQDRPVGELELFLPLRLVRPIGWIGVNRERRSRARRFQASARCNRRRCRACLERGLDCAAPSRTRRRRARVRGRQQADEMAGVRSGRFRSSPSLRPACRPAAPPCLARRQISSRPLRPAVRFAFARRQLREQFVALARFRGNILAGVLLE